MCEVALSMKMEGLENMFATEQGDKEHSLSEDSKRMSDRYCSNPKAPEIIIDRLL